MDYYNTPTIRLMISDCTGVVCVIVVCFNGLREQNTSSKEILLAFFRLFFLICGLEGFPTNALDIGFYLKVFFNLGLMIVFKAIIDFL